MSVLADNVDVGMFRVITRGKQSKQWFTRAGKLKHITKLKPWSLVRVLVSRDCTGVPLTLTLVSRWTSTTGVWRRPRRSPPSSRPCWSSTPSGGPPRCSASNTPSSETCPADVSRDLLYYVYYDK